LGRENDDQIAPTESPFPHKLRCVLLSMLSSYRYSPPAPRHPRFPPRAYARVCAHVTILRYTLNIEVDFPCLDMINASLSEDKK